MEAEQTLQIALAENGPREVRAQTNHVREVCLLAAIHALEHGQSQVSCDDLIWAHTTLLDGRKAAADPNTCEPPQAKKAGNGLGFAGKSSRNAEGSLFPP